MSLRRLANFAFVILLIVGWGLFFFQFLQNRDSDGFKGRNFYHGIRFFKDAPNFILTDFNGDTKSLTDFKGKLILLAWGFTHCPDICPLILSRLKTVMKELGDQGDRVQVLFITIDPERDTPGRLKSYVPSFHSSFIGLTGSQEEIQNVVEAYDAFFIKHPEVYGRGELDTWDSYQMTHTTKVYLIDQNGRLLLYYPYDKLKPTKIAEDIKRILKG